MCQGRLSQETYDKIEAFVDKWPKSSFGPAHILLDDCNVLDTHIRFCIARLDDYQPENYSTVHTEEELKATRTFLLELLDIPEGDR
jgi:hypothetical protein